jgi:hypothetical protein
MFVYVIILAFCTAAINLGVAFYNYWHNRVRSGWMLVTGHVESGDLRNDQKDSYLLEMLERSALVAEVGYSYSVGGSYYAGHRTRAFRDEAEAWNYLDGYQKGNEVRIYYDPENPDDSIMEPTPINNRKYLMAGFVFLAVGTSILMLELTK